MPLDRACVIHRLHDLVLRTKGTAQDASMLPDDPEGRQLARRARYPVVRLSHRTLLDLGG